MRCQRLKHSRCTHFCPPLHLHGEISGPSSGPPKQYRQSRSSSHSSHAAMQRTEAVEPRAPPKAGPGADPPRAGAARALRRRRARGACCVVGAVLYCRGAQKNASTAYESGATARTGAAARARTTGPHCRLPVTLGALLSLCLPSSLPFSPLGARAARARGAGWPVAG